MADTVVQATDGDPRVTASQGGSEEGATPRLVSVRLGDRTVNVPEDVAELYQRELNARDGRHGAELQQLRGQVEQLQAAMQEPDDNHDTYTGPREPDPDLLLTNPDEFVRQNSEYQAALINAAGAALEQRHQEDLHQLKTQIDRDRQWQSITDRFYEKYPAFKTPNRAKIVNLVYQENKQELAPLSIEEGLDRIAELASAFMVEVAEAGKEEAGKRRTPTLESSRRATRTTPVENPKEDDNLGTLGDWIRARKVSRERVAV